ncbi:MAG: type II toxin-antitoxin system VapC family toxin [Pseudonocardiales bacterium]|nr:type II toxin-antitoxin system VapC family toxin [Pseudonocardiales bacterium]
MRLLLDTNVLIWWLEESPRLGKETREAIAGEFEVTVSAVSAFEIAAKVAIGKLRTPGDLAAQIAEQEMIELPVTVRHGLAVGQLPMHHRDPFDRLLIAQARCEGFTIVTADRAFTTYDVPIMPA